MSKELTTTPTSGSITPREAEAKIEVLHGRLVPVDGQPTRFCVPRGSEATTAERRALSAVQRRLEQERAGCTNRDHIDVVVSRVILGFEKGAGSEDNTERLAREFIDGLVGLPLWAIHGAADRFRGGEALTKWNRAFRPSPAEFAAEARAGMIENGRMLVHVRQILEAEVYDPPTDEDRAKVAAAAASWLNRGGETEPGRPRPSPEAVAAAREDVLHEHGAKFREVAVGSLAQLAARLDAKAAQREDAA